MRTHQFTLQNVRLTPIWLALLPGLVLFSSAFARISQFCNGFEGTRYALRINKDEDMTTEEWVADQTCVDSQWYCTPSMKSWSPEKYSRDPCKTLKGKRVAFVGDSYARHAYIAFLSWLSDNYQHAALGKIHDLDCEYENQYSEKKCREKIIHAKTVCDGHTNVSLFYGHAPHVDSAKIQHHDMIVWSIGRHPYDGNYSHRLGVNDAYAMYTGFFGPRCESYNSTLLAEFCKKVVWLDTHVRVMPHHADENYNQELKFHIEAPTWIFRSCNVQRFASAWDATDRLVSNHISDAQKMSFDGVHWGSAVNLLKAQAVLKAWEKKIRC